MATSGFEFAYSLDGSNATPVIRDLPVHGTGAYAIGDLVVVNGSADGEVQRVTSTTAEVTGVMQEARASGADAAVMKVAILTREQVWRCSMDAATTAFVVGYTKSIDTTDHNTISASDSTGGKMILVDKSSLDNDGNVLAYVVFSDTTFGNT
jgi:hypothetical protein